MADGIGRIGSGSTSGVGSFYTPNNSRGNVEEPDDQNGQVKPEYKEVNETEVWNFLMNSSYFISSVKEAEQPNDIENGAAVGMDERAAGCMPNFELAFALIQEEFGFETATMLMNKDEFVDRLLEFFGQA